MKKKARKVKKAEVPQEAKSLPPQTPREVIFTNWPKPLTTWERYKQDGINEKIVPEFLRTKNLRRQHKKERAELVRRELENRRLRKLVCKHHYEGNHYGSGSVSIAWHQHSQGIISGVCKICLSQFDTRNPEDKKLYDSPANLSNIRNMGRAGNHAQVPPPPAPPKLNWWQKTWKSITDTLFGFWTK